MTLSTFTDNFTEWNAGIFARGSWNRAIARTARSIGSILVRSHRGTNAIGETINICSPEINMILYDYTIARGPIEHHLRDLLGGAGQ